jgi:hypothetical protein
MTGRMDVDVPRSARGSSLVSTASMGGGRHKPLWPSEIYIVRLA